MGASKAGAPSKAVTKVATLSKHAFGAPEDHLTLESVQAEAPYHKTMSQPQGPAYGPSYVPYFSVRKLTLNTLTCPDFCYSGFH